MSFRNYGNEIIQAYMMGQELARRKQEEEFERAYKAAVLHETMRRNTAAESLREQQLQRLLDSDIIREALQSRNIQRQEATAQSDAKSKWAGMLAEGKVKFPVERTTITPKLNMLDFMESFALNKPFETVSQKPFQVPGFKDLTISPSEVPGEQERFETMRREAFAKQAPRLQMFDREMQLKQDQFEHLKQYRKQVLSQNAERIEIARKRLALSAQTTKSDSEQFRAMNKVDSIVKEALRTGANAPYTQFSASEAAHNWTRVSKQDPKAPGMYDIGLLFRWINALDNSVVRYSEVELVREAQNRLAPLGFKVKRWAGVNSPILDEDARRAIKSQIADLYKVRKATFFRTLESAYNRAKIFKPDITRREFGDLIGTFPPVDDKGSEFEIPSAGIEEWVNETFKQREIPGMTPVIAVPKTGR